MNWHIVIAIAALALALLFAIFAVAEVRRSKSYNDYLNHRYEWRYISWYVAPFSDHTEYLAWADDDQGGFIYTRDHSKAYRFTTYELAYNATPKYDGSDGIENRAGVEQVRRDA